MQAFLPVHDVLGMDLEELDITDALRCRTKVRETGPEVIINAAALTDVDYCESHEEEAMLVNGQGIGNLAEAAASNGARLIHYSTDYVFDGCKDSPYHEDDSPNPQTAYGRSKLRGEELLRRSVRDHLILRISWLFGRKGKNFIRTIISAARENRPLRVVDDQRGSPCYTRDVAAHTQRMMHSGCRGTYHLTNAGSCTWYELALSALQCAGITGVPVAAVTTAEFPRPAPRPASSILANARLEREGIPLMRPWQEAVREYVQTCLSPPDA
jgi:dTDP-4-dehydrorhamnose reductase